MSPRSSDAARPAPGGLVDIVSGSFGAGHDAAASAIADRLQARGFRTRTWDVVDLMPGRLGRAVRSGYLRQVQSAPASWRWLLHAVERREGVAAGIGRALETTEGGLLEIAADGPAAIVSTHPFASQALGHLRSIGRLEAPVTTYLTDRNDFDAFNEVFKETFSDPFPARVTILAQLIVAELSIEVTAVAARPR